MDNTPVNEVDLLDKLCDELDNIGIEGNVIERDILNGDPYVVIWPGKFEDRKIVLTEELFFVHICANRQYEVLPSAKYKRYFGEHFWSCRSEKRGYYIMTFLKLIGTIEYLLKKENNMSKITTEATRELCHIIAYEVDKSPLRWTSKVDDIIYIHNMNDDDTVCSVRIYETSLKNSPVRAYYYVYFTKKYSSIAKEIKDLRIAGITEADGYKFVSPRHVVDFVREVVRLKEKGEVVDRIGRTKEEPIMMKWEVRTPYTMNDLPTIRAVDVIFNDPATIIIWADGTKTVVKSRDGEEFDPEKGLAMAISKRVLGNKYDYYDVFKKYVGRYEKKQKKGKK